MSKKIDFVSDLHIEMWDPQYNIKHPCGERSNNPLDINIFKNSDSKILIVAGDTSDSLELSIKKLDEIGKYYEKVLFIDGNHEHVNKIPNMYSQYEIEELTNKINKSRGNSNNKLHFLSISPYQVGKSVIIGVNGWWDYNNYDEETIKDKSMNYFNNWHHVSKSNSKIYCYNCLSFSSEDYKRLSYFVKKYENDETVNNIIIVTHTVPLEIFADYMKMSTDGNTKLINVLNYSSKISHWIFGHSHKTYDYKYNDVRFISNPRGRYEDENREKYDVKSIEIK